MNFFLAEPIDRINEKIILRGEEARHCARSLRARVGESIMVSDGAGTMFRVVIEEILKESIRCRIEGEYPKFNELETRVALALAVLKNPGRMEFAIEKGTELGITTFIPLKTERTIAGSVKLTRYEHLVRAAVKQSGRSRIPSLVEWQTLADLFHYPAQIKILLHETEDQNDLLRVLRENHNAESVLLAVGPEGGFTDEEVRSARGAGFVVVSLGERRLRAETAAVTACALAMSLLRKDHEVR